MHAALGERFANQAVGLRLESLETKGAKRNGKHRERSQVRQSGDLDRW